MGNAVGNATYQCLHCRLAQRAEVRTIMLSSHHMRGAGRGDANSALAMLLALKRCPRCGHFDRRIASFHRHTVRVGLIGYALLIGIVAITLFAIPSVPKEALYATLGVLVIGGVLLFRRLRHRYPTNVERRVSLLGPAAPNQWY
jgi:hypothetical protein